MALIASTIMRSIRRFDAGKISVCPMPIASVLVAVSGLALLKLVEDADIVDYESVRQHGLCEDRRGRVSIAIAVAFG